jgi:hypothetical protein
VIVRILGDGKYELSDDRIGELADLITAVRDGDEFGFGPALATVVGEARRFGTPYVHIAPVDSDVVLPALDADLAEIRAQLIKDGLIRV